MGEQAIKVLLIEDNPADAELVRAMLARIPNLPIQLEYASLLSTGLTRLEGENLDVVVLDLNLSDARGFDAFARASAAVPDVPIIILTNLEDEALALRAVQDGAQDYLFKGHVDGPSLAHAIRCAIERQRMGAALRSCSLLDELTGLYNRRGFLLLAEQQYKVAGRNRKPMALLFADMDGLKHINDTFGHPEGDRALAEAAEALRETFRESDIVARLGGDEFVVLLVGGLEDRGEAGMKRLLAKLEACNARNLRPYTLSLSLGIAIYDHNHPRSLDDLQGQADALMYEQKRRKKACT